MKYKKKSKAVIAITLTLASMICIGATTIGAYATPSGNNVLSEDKQVDKEKLRVRKALPLVLRHINPMVLYITRNWTEPFGMGRR